MERLRKVLYHTNQDSPDFRFSRCGHFHCWGGTSEHPFAIIEGTDGYIYEIPSNAVRFWPTQDAIPKDWLH